MRNILLCFTISVTVFILCIPVIHVENQHRSKEFKKDSLISNLRVQNKDLLNQLQEADDSTFKLLNQIEKLKHEKHPAKKK